MSTQGDASKRPLPEGWRWVKLGEVIREAQPGFACGERDPNGVIQLRMNNVDTRGNCVWDEFIRVPADASTIEKYSLKPGDVLFNNTNSVELVGKTALFTGYKEPVVYSNHLTVLRTRHEYLNAEYLARFLVWQWQSGVFQHICNRWIGQSAVKNDKLLSIEIPLPPLAEQKRIAAILREQMAAVERARRAAEEQLEAAKALPAAFLRQVFPRPGQPPPEGWRWVKLGEVCRVVGGSTPSSHIQNYWDGDIVWITPKDLGKLESPIITSSERRISKEGYASCGTELVPIGSVVLSSRAPIGHLGIAGVPLCTNQGCKSFVPSSQVDSYFLYFSLKVSVPKLQSLGSGATFAEVSKAELEGFDIPLPPLAEQKRIAAILREQMASAERVRKAIEEQLEAINKLPEAILRKAFRGEL